jgi:hypothetical protein
MASLYLHYSNEGLSESDYPEFLHFPNSKMSDYRPSSHMGLMFHLKKPEVDFNLLCSLLNGRQTTSKPPEVLIISTRYLRAEWKSSSLEKSQSESQMAIIKAKMRVVNSFELEDVILKARHKRLKSLVRSNIQASSLK